jgi:hypothetical protein
LNDAQLLNNLAQVLTIQVSRIHVLVYLLKSTRNGDTRQLLSLIVDSLPSMFGQRPAQLSLLWVHSAVLIPFKKRVKERDLILDIKQFTQDQAFVLVLEDS